MAFGKFIFMCNYVLDVSSLIYFLNFYSSYGISKNGRCMIADDMGLGKTIQALGIAHYFKESWPLLIVAPSSVK